MLTKELEQKQDAFADLSRARETEKSDLERQLARLERLHEDEMSAKTREMELALEDCKNDLSDRVRDLQGKVFEYEERLDAALREKIREKERMEGKVGDNRRRLL